MKRSVLLLCLMFSFVAKAQEKCSAGKDPMTDLKHLCAELNKTNKDHCRIKLPSDKETVPPVTYSLLSASGKMKGLFAKMEELQNAFMQEAAGCPGGCSRVPAPVVEISTRPTAVVPDTACPARFTAVKLSEGELRQFGVAQSDVYFKKTFRQRGKASKCQADASEFAQNTLMGENPLGTFLEEQKCKSPCSYASVIRLKSQDVGDGQCALDLELAVNCGPPKKDREWVTEASLTKSFRCEVAP